MIFYTFQIKLLDVTNSPVPGTIVRVYLDDELILQEESGSDGCIIFNDDLSPYLDKERDRYKVEVASHTISGMRPSHILQTNDAVISNDGTNTVMAFPLKIIV